MIKASNKTKWLATIILALVFAVTAGFGVTSLYSANADERVVEDGTGVIYEIETYHEIPTDLVYFSFAANGAYTYESGAQFTSVQSATTYACSNRFTDYIYINDVPLLESAAFKHETNPAWNQIHVNWAVDSATVGYTVVNAQYFAISLYGAALKEGDKITIKKGFSLIEGGSIEYAGEGAPIYYNDTLTFRTLGKDYVYTFHRESDYCYFYDENDKECSVNRTMDHDVAQQYLRVGFDIPYSKRLANLQNYAYYRKYVLFNGEEPGTAADTTENFIHSNYWGDGLSLIPHQSYMYFAAYSAKTVTLKKGMYVACGKVLDKDYNITLNTETNTWMVDSPVLLDSEDSDSYVNNVDAVNKNVTLYISFNGYAVEERTDFELYPTISKGLLFNGKPVCDVNAEYGQQIWWHFNYGTYTQQYDYRPTWMVTILDTLLDSFDMPVLTLPEGMQLASGRLGKTYNFVFNKETRNWALDKVNEVVPCDAEDNEVNNVTVWLDESSTVSQKLPTNVKLKYASGRNEIVAVTWDEQSYNAAGNYTATGSFGNYCLADGVSAKANLSVIVNDFIKTVEQPAQINTVYGNEETLPTTVTATMESGAVVTLGVAWTGYENGKFAPTAADTFTLNGVINAGEYLYKTADIFNTTLTVIADKAEITVTAKDATITYGEALPAFDYSIAGAFVEGDALNIAVNTTADGKTVGTFDIIASGTSDNYEITFVTGTLTVNKAEIIVTAKDATITYGEALPAFDYSIAGAFVEGDALNIAVATTADGKTVGTFDITASGTSDNYEITFVTGTLTVNKAEIIVTAKDATITYGEALPAFDYNIAGAIVEGDALDITVATTADGKTVGTFDIIASGTSDNYEITFVAGTLTVNKDTVTAVTLCDEEGNEVAAPEAKQVIPVGSTISLPAYVKLTYAHNGTEVVALNWSKTEFTTAGAFTTVATFNYDEAFYTMGAEFALSVEVTVTDKIVSVGTISDIDTYYGEEVTLPTTVTAETYTGATVTLNVTWTGYESGKFTPNEVAIFTINGVAAVGDYTVADGVSLEVSVTVVAAKAEITVTVKDVTVTYGDAIPEAFDFDITEGALVEGDTIGASFEYAVNVGEGNVGEYAITASGASDKYEITFVAGTLTINPAKITVTAKDETVTYGEAFPSFGYNITEGAIVEGDTLDIAVNTAADGKSVGTFDIIASGTSANYEITFVAGTLTINPAKITVTAKDVTVTYGEALPAFGYDVTEGAIVEGDTLDITVATTADGKTVGTFDITASGTSANYEITFVAGTLTVNPAKITVTANDVTMIYGDSFPEAFGYTVTVGAIVEGDTLDITVATTADGKTVGTFDIIASGTSANYEITFVAGTLTVDKDTVIEITLCDEDGNEVSAPAEKITVNAGATVATLPAYVELAFASGRSTVVALSWSQTEFNTLGKVTTVATFSYDETVYAMGEGVEFSLSVEVSVVDEITAIGTLTDINTYYGAETTLPATVTANTASGATVNLAIVWASEKYVPTEVGTITVTGTVNVGENTVADGVSIEVSVKVIAAKAKITVRAKDVAIKYGEDFPVFEYEVVSGTLVEGDTLDDVVLSCEADGTRIGAFEITISGTSDKYDITFENGTFIISANVVNVTGGCFAGFEGEMVLLCAIAVILGIALIRNKKSSSRC